MNTRNRCGVSLVEILIAACLFCLFLVLIVQATSFFQRSFLRHDNLQGQLSQAETFLLNLGAEIRDARSISIPSSGERKSGLALVDAAGTEIRYSLGSSGTLTRETGDAHSGRTCVQNVRELVFSRFQANTVAVELSLKGQGPNEFRLLTSFQAPGEERP